MKRKQIKKFIMLLVIISAGGSMIINFENGFERWVWQLCTLIWAGTAYTLEMENENLKEFNNKI